MSSFTKTPIRLNRWASLDRWADFLDQLALCLDKCTALLNDFLESPQRPEYELNRTYQRVLNTAATGIWHGLRVLYPEKRECYIWPSYYRIVRAGNAQDRVLLKEITSWGHIEGGAWRSLRINAEEIPSPAAALSSLVFDRLLNPRNANKLHLHPGSTAAWISQVTPRTTMGGSSRLINLPPQVLDVRCRKGKTRTASEGNQGLRVDLGNAELLEWGESLGCAFDDMLVGRKWPALDDTSDSAVAIARMLYDPWLIATIRAKSYPPDLRARLQSWGSRLAAISGQEAGFMNDALRDIFDAITEVALSGGPPWTNWYVVPVQNSIRATATLNLTGDDTLGSFMLLTDRAVDAAVLRTLAPWVGLVYERLRATERESLLRQRGFDDAFGGFSHEMTKIVRSIDSPALGDVVELHGGEPPRLNLGSLSLSDDFIRISDEECARFQIAPHDRQTVIPQIVRSWRLAHRAEAFDSAITLLHLWTMHESDRTKALIGAGRTIEEAVRACADYAIQMHAVAGIQDDTAARPSKLEDLVEFSLECTRGQAPISVELSGVESVRKMKLGGLNYLPSRSHLGCALVALFRNTLEHKGPGPLEIELAFQSERIQMTPDLLVVRIMNQLKPEELSMVARDPEALRKSERGSTRILNFFLNRLGGQHQNGVKVRGDQLVFESELTCRLAMLVPGETDG